MPLDVAGAWVEFGGGLFGGPRKAALRGDKEKGLFFRGSERLPFGDAIRPVRELLQFLLNEPGHATT